MPLAAILGTGLIGTSIGLALKANGWAVTGWDPDPAALAEAAEVGGLDSVSTDRPSCLVGADLVVLAGPPATIVADLPDLATGALVTDVAGVKAPVVAAASHLPHFVGGHPMAGRERAGARAASGALFRGAAWILATDGVAGPDLDRMASVVASLGARPVFMTAAEHDEAVAAVSHLPQVLASALVGVASRDSHALDLAGGSFRDLTRVALSEPDWWAELMVTNRRSLLSALTALRSELDRWSAALERGDAAPLASALETSRALRRRMAPPVVAVGVILEDRPGELAAVGRTLAATGVDVRDLQLRHAPHGGGGVLTLSVRPGEAEALRDALVAEGFELAG